MLPGVNLQPGDCMDRALKWVFSYESGEPVISEACLQEHLHSIHANQLVLVYVDPSVGAEIGVVARTIKRN